MIFYAIGIYIMAWKAADIEFAILDDMTDQSVVTARIATPIGTLLAMAEPDQEGRTLVLRGLHMHAETAGANAVGAANLRMLADVVMERMDYDEVIVEGAIRTSGANPGHRPRRLRFTRRPVAASAARSTES